MIETLAILGGILAACSVASLGVLFYLAGLVSSIRNLATVHFEPDEVEAAIDAEERRLEAELDEVRRQRTVARKPR